MKIQLKFFAVILGLSSWIVPNVVRAASQNVVTAYNEFAMSYAGLPSGSCDNQSLAPYIDALNRLTRFETLAVAVENIPDLSAQRGFLTEVIDSHAACINPWAGVSFRCEGPCGGGFSNQYKEAIKLPDSIVLKADQSRSANTLKFISHKGDGRCPDGHRLATYAEASGNRNQACSALSQWAIARLADGSSMVGRGYRCETIENDNRSMGDSLCVEGKPRRTRNVANSSTSTFVPSDDYYRLKTMFQGSDKCLEGNQFASTSTLGGSAFMDSCQNVSGQLWKFVAANDGYYRMKTMFQGETKCFEGNKFARSSTLNGAAFMDDCQNVSGQLWKIVPAANGYSRLKTLFQGENKCLEGNKFDRTSTLGGAAFMDDCQNVSGQLWKFEPR